MRLPSRKFVLTAAVLAVAGGGVAHAAAEKMHTMQVSAPDGSVVHVAYAGDVAPRVEFVPAETVRAADPFAEMDRISAMMDAQMHAMMQRAAVMQRQAAQLQQQGVTIASTGNAIAPGLTLVGDMPKGMHMSYVSTTTDARGCTRSVSYTSDGSDAAPKVIQAASDSCDAVAPNMAPQPAKAEKPVAPAVPTPGERI